MSLISLTQEERIHGLGAYSDSQAVELSSLRLMGKSKFYRAWEEPAWTLGRMGWEVGTCLVRLAGPVFQGKLAKLSWRMGLVFGFLAVRHFQSLKADLDSDSWAGHWGGLHFVGPDVRNTLIILKHNLNFLISMVLFIVLPPPQIPSPLSLFPYFSKAYLSSRTQFKCHHQATASMRPPLMTPAKMILHFCETPTHSGANHLLPFSFIFLLFPLLAGKFIEGKDCFVS